MFHSIASTWNNVLTSATDVKEVGGPRRGEEEGLVTIWRFVVHLSICV